MFESIFSIFNWIILQLKNAISFVNKMINENIIISELAKYLLYFLLISIAFGIVFYLLRKFTN